MIENQFGRRPIVQRFDPDESPGEFTARFVVQAQGKTADAAAVLAWTLCARAYEDGATDERRGRELVQAMGATDA